jgi:hypothetical protein
MEEKIEKLKFVKLPIDEETGKEQKEFEEMLKIKNLQELVHTKGKIQECAYTYLKNVLKERRSNIMCEYCEKIVNNKKILDIDNEEETHMEIINQKKSWGYMLYVEIEGQDNDGYKPSQFFQINYCLMCGRKLREE